MTEQYIDTECTNYNDSFPRFLSFLSFFLLSFHRHVKVNVDYSVRLNLRQQRTELKIEHVYKLYTLERRLFAVNMN